MALQDGLVVPGAHADELLRRLDVASGKGQRHRLDGLPLQIEQLPGEVLPRPVPLLGTPEEWGEVGVVGDQLGGQILDVPGSEVITGRMGRRRRGNGAGMQHGRHRNLLHPQTQDPCEVTL